MANRNTFFQDESINKKIDFKQLMRTLKYALPYKKMIIGVGIMLLISSVVSLIPPRVLKVIVDRVVDNKEYAQLYYLCGMMGLLAIIEILITFFQTRIMGKVGFSIISKIRTDLFNKLQQLSFDYYDNRPDGKIVVCVTEYINGLAVFFSNYIMMFSIYLIKIVVVTVFMLYLSVKLTAIVFITVIPMITGVVWLKKRLDKKYTKLRAKNSNRSAFLVESIMGEQIIKNYNRVETNKKIYSQIHDESVDVWWNIIKWSRLNGPIVIGFWNMGTLLIYGVALLSLLSGADIITVGSIITFTSYMTVFQEPVSQIATIIQEFAQVSSNLERVFDTIDQDVAIQDCENAVVLSNVKGNVDFDDVTFAYEEGNNILEHFDLHVKAGQKIALVGPTGAGKTTVINMLTRFYDVASGAVNIDGVNVKDIKLESLRKEVGVLMQDPFIFKGTIIENIRYGKCTATDEECIEAARKIGADKFIERFSGGFYHEVEERGGDLSAGEKQLISFARIVLKNPAIIILDEATSFIDTETEMMIKEVFDLLTKEKTTFVVAHRLSTIENSDKILYICNKRILESGTHKELLAKRGYYFDLVH